MYSITDFRDLLTSPEFAVEAAVLDRFGHMRRANSVLPLQVGDGAGYLEQTVVSARRQPQLLDRCPQQSPLPARSARSRLGSPVGPICALQNSGRHRFSTGA